jgi:hypothetical protein
MNPTPAEAARQAYVSHTTNLESVWKDVSQAAIDAHLAQVSSDLPTEEEILVAEDSGGLAGVRDLFTSRFAKLQAELETERDCKTTAIKTLNRYGEIIGAMATALDPKEGEHNIDAAKRVAAERDKLTRQLFECRQGFDVVVGLHKREKEKRDEAEKACAACNILFPALKRDIKTIADERDTLRQQLGDLLAIIHRDGGQYEEENGTEGAKNDAISVVLNLRGQAEEHLSIEKVKELMASAYQYGHQDTVESCYSDPDTVAEDLLTRKLKGKIE